VDGYARDLLAAAKATPPRMPTLLDRLLVCSLIEARSCERFRLLSEGLRSGELRSFYRELMESEARHYRLFRRLAEQCFGVEDARSRFEALAACEASIAARLPLGPTVHG
jgi:tRNA-(ms[2]io[6]A)-hydroxylase